MTSVVLIYKGAPSLRKDAEMQMRRQLGSSDFVCRANNLFEAQVDDRQLAIIRCDPDWQVSFPTFAEIRKPATNWGKVREKLAHMK